MKGYRIFPCDKILKKSRTSGWKIEYYRCMKKIFYLFCLLVSNQLQARPQEIKTSVFLMSVTKFNISDGHYQVDFYLSLRSDSAMDDNFDLMNGQITQKQVEENEPGFKVYRIKALCYENLDFHRFPFENHRLTIQIEHKLKPAGQLVYVPDPERSGADPEVAVIGWKLNPAHIRESVNLHYYKTFDETYSRYSFSFKLEKPLLASLFKGLIPPVIIVAAMFLLFFMNPQEPKDRVNATASMLIANVVLHINSTSALPPLGYATFQDKLMITNYVAIGCSLMVIMMLVDAVRRNLPDRAAKLNARARWLLLGGYFLAIAFQFFT